MTAFERLGQWLAPVRRRWKAPDGLTVVSPQSSPFGLVWVPLLALAIGGAVVLSPLSARMSSALYDFSIRAVARPAHFDDVVVIDIDDASLRDLRPRLGGWPYSRDTFALLISFLRDIGAGPIALNLVFSEPRDGDDRLAQALVERSDVVLAAVGQQRGGTSDLRSDPLRRRVAMASASGLPAARWAEMVMPDEALLSTLARAAVVGTIGVVSTELDDDGLLRRLSLLHEADGRVYPSMALAPKLLALAGSTDRLARDTDAVSLGQQRWPVNAAGQVTLLLPNNRDAVPRLSFSSVMETALGLGDRAAMRKVLEGRTVFIGSSAFLADDVVTPLGRVSGTGLLAGAHAALGRNLVLAPPAPWLAVTLATIALAPSFLVWLRRRPMLRDDFLASLSALVIVVAGGLAMLVRGRIEVELLLPLVIAASGFLIATLLQLQWVGLANRQLRIERAMAEAANQAKSEFLANVSHEIRTPMNALLGVAELLQCTPLNEEQQRYVAVFQRSGQTLFELINDLLDLSKIEAGRLELDPGPFSLHRLLSDQHELLKTRAVGKGLELQWQLVGTLPDAVVGDRRRLAQVLTNLIGNAIKFTAIGRVTVKVSQTGAGTCFEVNDTGIGIGVEQHQRIFQPFTQADGSMTRQYGGTGLGLSIASGLVGQMGGVITVRSELGSGSTFAFCIPLAPASAAQTVALRTSPPQPPPPPPAPQQVRPAAPEPARSGLATATHRTPVRILLTEDNEINVLLVEAMLQDARCTLDVAANGETALSKYCGGEYDLILMDIQMPGIDGHQTTREIRRIEAAEGRRPVMVIALTAHAFERDVHRSMEAGCNAHLTKPVSRDALLAAVESCRDAAIGEADVQPV